MAASYFSLSLSLFYYLTIISTVVADDAVPFAATWSEMTYGPDGPWPAVEVILGVDQKIALYPGREFQSFLLTSDYCNYNDTCTATKAHLYNQAQAQVDSTGGAAEIQWAPGPDFMNGLAVAGENAKSWIDNMDLGGLSVPNVSLALLSESYAVYPDDTWYPLSVGCLGLGAPGTVNQSFTTGGPSINASLVPGWLAAEKQIPSNSFSMHIGSTNPKMPGSLYFGGYDQNRIVGDILTEDGDYTKAITLKDIAITVVEGSSPWAFESKPGLLAENNASISTAGIKISVDGCSPYLTLPKSTCDSITSHLPVKYKKELGLYIWQQDDPKYSQIVSSASSLDFTFLAGSNTKHVTISVPFRHLNLTLTQPLVDDDEQYFPCYTGSTKYTLGRAFLQDAFVGANWDSKTWWLAQAPGPNIPSADVVTLTESDTEIKASQNDWKESWSGSWKALSDKDVSSTQPVIPNDASSTSNTIPNDPSSTSKTTPTPIPSSSTGLSTGAIAGIGVGVGLVAIAAIVALVFFLLRRRKSKTPQAGELDGAANSSQQYPSHAVPTGSYQPPNGMSQHGYYAPVKNPGPPGSSDVSDIYSQNANYGQQYPQQYGQQYADGYPQPYAQQYSAELPANTVTELPGPDVQHLQSPGSSAIRQPSPSPSHELPNSGRQ